MTRIIKNSAFISITIAVLLAAASIAFGQNAKKLEVEKVAFWGDAATNVQVFLTVDGRLTVISEKSVRVDYHTSINSWQAVDSELTSTGTLGSTVKQFQVKHSFSRTTIWMALEFTIDGKKVPGLTRTFYDNIFDTVENGQFMKKP